MSMPPQGGWQQGPTPPNHGQPYGQPFDPSAYNPQQQPPPPGWQQGSWAPQPGPPPAKGGGLKWLLITVAVLLVVAVSIGATLLFTRGGNGGDPTPTSGAPSDIASANDTGPVSIITEEPTCGAFNGIISTLAEVEKRGWGDQRNSLPAANEWTSEQRSQVQSVATAMENAAEQVLPLAKQTPHRVMRELYEQYVAFGRAYSDSIPNYIPDNNFLADANVNIGNALLGICNSIEYGSARRSIAVAPVARPTQPAQDGGSTKPQRFVTSPTPQCATWTAREITFTTGTSDWERLNPDIPASQWTPEQRVIQKSALTQFSALADDMESTGRESGNAVFEDFAVLGAIYFRAYVASGDNYTSADSWLSYSALRLLNTVSVACQAAAK